MAYPWILYDNLFADYSATLTASSDGTASGYSVDNVGDWRPYTLWVAGATANAYQGIELDLGSGNSEDPDTVVVYNHNTTECGASTLKLIVEYSDDGIAWSAASSVNVSDDYIHFETWTGKGSHRWWRVFQRADSRTTAASIGIICLGTRLQFNEGFPGDPYAETNVVDAPQTDFGYPLGADVKWVRKRMELDFAAFSPAGIAASWFTGDGSDYTDASPTANSGFDDFIQTHLRSGKPFFFGWNEDYGDKENAHFAHVPIGSGIGQGFIGSVARRNLRMTMELVVET